MRNTIAIPKTKFIFLSIKRNILSAIFCIFTICLVIFSKSNLASVKEGLSLWINSVVPSLLPFFIATELLTYTNVVKVISNLLNPIMKPVFNVSGVGAFVFIMGILSGYPVGAKLVSNFRSKGLLSRSESERLLTFTNNSGPLFIIGTVGISLFGNTLIGVLLFITHLLACITVGFIFRFWKYKDKNSSSSYSPIKDNFVTFSNLGEVISKSIISSINTVVLIGGFIILFSVILSILKSSNLLNIVSYIFKPFLGTKNLPFSTGILSGFLELTNGIKIIASIPNKCISINIIVCAFLLGFGGISVLLQVLSITSKTDISIKPYIIGKLLHGVFAAIYTFIIISSFPIFNFNL